MQVFSNAQNFTITGAQFTETTINLSGPTGIDILLEASYPESAHDSSDLEYSPRCFPGTREQYTKDIVNWGVPALGDTPAPIYWMKGPAGVGKTAVAQTCAKELNNMEKLGAAFFFSISGRNKPEKFFPSIAYQLSTVYPAYQDLIDDKIRRDKTLVKKAMSSQFQYLIERPLRELSAQGKGIRTRVVVIVDGLDECEGAHAQSEIVRIVAEAASKSTLPLCWAFFSRPEPHIEAMFARDTIAPHCHKITLPISRDSDGEIELYLKSGFEGMLQRRGASMGFQWPSTEDMEIIVGAARGSFIYATTVIRFVDHLGSLGLEKRLRAIIDMILDRRGRNPHASTSADQPFAELDASYRMILERIPTEIYASVHLLLALLCQWGTLGAVLAANILGLSREEFETVYNLASAVVQLQDPGKVLELDPTVDTNCTYAQVNPNALKRTRLQVGSDLGGRVSFYHKSFGDFLLDPARSGIYCTKVSEVLVAHYHKMHLDYDRSYCWRGSELVTAPGASDSASSLSYPYTNELVNSLLKARVYIHIGAEDAENFPIPGDPAGVRGECDFRKHMHIVTNFWVRRPVAKSALVWGCECRQKTWPGTRIRTVSWAKFDVNEFKLMIKERQRANIIQQYHPDWTSWFKSFVPDKPQERVESALYRIGHGEKSIFWYWEIDYDLQRYREFRTTDLAEGEKLFREEDFNSWPDWGKENL